MENKEMSIAKMKEMQMELFELHKHEWEDDMYPEAARNHLLYMIEELGECISIIKKKGIDAIMNDKTVREDFIIEMTDVQRYYVEVLNRLNITAEEYESQYMKKHEECVGRNYKKKWENEYK